MKAKSKGRYQGLLNDIKELQIDRDATYVATDGADNSITNAQMAQAVSDNKAAAFYQVNNTYMCIDSGTYTQNHIYKFTGTGWEDVTPIPTNVETTDNKVSTITTSDKTSTTKYPSVKAAVDYADALDANALHTSGTETASGVKTFSSGIKVAGASGIDTSSSADMVIKRYGTSQLRVTSTGLAPYSNNAKDLGTSSYYFKDLYIKGQLKDGTNNISLADIAAKSTVSVSDTGTATDEVKYITVNGVQKKIGSEGITVITLTGTSGTISDTDFAKIQANPSAVVFSLNGRKYTHNEDASTYISYSNVIYPTVDSQDTKVIYINTESTAVNYKTWSLETENPGGSVSIDDISITENDDGEIQTIGVIDQNTGNANKEWTGTRAEYEDIAVKDNNTTYYITDDNAETKLEVIDIGSTSTTIDAVTYPTMTKAVLDEIYTKYTAGKAIVLHWQLLGIHTYLSVVYTTDISYYEIDVVAHGKIAKYNWTNQTSELVAPTVESGSEKTYLHNIKMKTSEKYIAFSIKTTSNVSFNFSSLNNWLNTNGYYNSNHSYFNVKGFHFNGDKIYTIYGIYRDGNDSLIGYNYYQLSLNSTINDNTITNTFSLNTATETTNGITSSCTFSDYVVEE